MTPSRKDTKRALDGKRSERPFATSCRSSCEWPFALPLSTFCSRKSAGLSELIAPSERQLGSARPASRPPLIPLLSLWEAVVEQVHDSDKRAKVLEEERK
jgi:hypothetical protein